MTTTNLPVEAKASGNAPVAPKVIASGIGAGTGGTLGTAAIYLIGIFCPGGSFDASQVDKTLAAVPWPIAALVPGTLAVIGAVWGGYIAPHQARLEDVTEALARYTVGTDETAPAAHDVPPAAPADPAPADDVPDVPPADAPVALPADPAGAGA